MECHPTFFLSGHFSWRNTTNGSWFIQSLVKVLTRDSGHDDLLSMMTTVNRNMILNFESNCPCKDIVFGLALPFYVVSHDDEHPLILDIFSLFLSYWSSLPHFFLLIHGLLLHAPESLPAISSFLEPFQWNILQENQWRLSLFSNLVGGCHEYN